jgi:hypothetical protein
LLGQDRISRTVSAFPWERKENASQALADMRSWGESDWRSFWQLLDDEKNGLSAGYALDAFVHDAAQDVNYRKKASGILSAGIPQVKGFFAKDLLIRSTSQLGDDGSIKALSKLLTDKTYGGSAARALASIGSPSALKALDKAAKKATDPLKQDILMARAHADARGKFAASVQAPLYSLSKDERNKGFSMLFDGSNLDNWIGNKTAYQVEAGNIVVRPSGGSGGNLYTAEKYGDFELRFEFQLTPGANNGLGIRTPTEGDAAYVGMELQILDNEAEKYRNLKPYQYHGSVYGVIPAKRGFLKPTGEWNRQTVVAKGTRIKVILNDEVILDGDVKEASVNGTMDGNAHPGLSNSRGHIGFLGHGDVVRFRNIRIRKMD